MLTEVFCKEFADAWLAAQSYHKEKRYSKGMVQRSEWVDHVSEPRVLTQHNSWATRKPRTRCDRHGLPLTGCADVATALPGRDLVNQRSQE